MGIVDCDQHLYESRSMWADHIDPARRDDALAIVDDELGYPFLVWRDRPIEMADVHRPATDPAYMGRQRARHREGRPAEERYDDAVPVDYWEPAARVARLDAMGVDEAVLFPNFGLLWERALSGSLPALTANMGAWNRWCTIVREEGRGRLHPAAHVTLRDGAWLDDQLAALGAAGVALAMVAPAPVDGRPLSHPDHDRLWRSFVEHGVTPVFHVGEMPRPLDPGWYEGERNDFASVLDTVLLSTPPAIALTDLIVNGALARHPDLRVGVMELGARWVPSFVFMLDGAYDFAVKMNGRPPADLDGPPSGYFRRQVRVAAFSYEQPEQLSPDAGDLFMFCSDYPHAEGTAEPLPGYQRAGLEPATAPELFAGNVQLLLGA